jgi:hypothetical protein
MKRILLIFCLILMSITLIGCSQYTIQESTLPKDYEAFQLMWQEGDNLIYQNEKGLFLLKPYDLPKTLWEETITEKEQNQSLYNWYYGSSPDHSYYLLSTNERENLILCGPKSGERRVLVQSSAQIGEAGWFDNENIYYTLKYGLYIVNILNNETFTITEADSNLQSKSDPNTQEPYIFWGNNIVKIKDELYYNSIRDYPNLSRNDIFCSNKTQEKKLLNDATLLLPVNNNYFIYTRWNPPEADYTQQSTYLYDITTGNSTLMTDKPLLRNSSFNSGIFVLNNGKLALMTGEMAGENYEGIVFDPVTLKEQTFPISKLNTSDSDIAQHQFGRFMGALELDGAYVFLFSEQDMTYSQGEWNTIYYAYNAVTKELIQIKNLNKDNRHSVEMYISPSGKYVAVCRYEPGSRKFKFDIVESIDLLRK